ncbi:MAG: COX15/CtaA family protein [Pseudomonadota bacterium]
MLFHRLSQLAAALALLVVVLGAWVRLTDAGLGCPDWPGCYGLIGVPTAEHEVAQANAAFPERPVEQGKAWREMIHRYLASTLGLLVVTLAGMAVARRRRDPQQPLILPLALVGLVIAQGILGMLTVTLLLKPVVVMGHLLGGMSTLVLLWLLALRSAPVARAAGGSVALAPALRTLSLVAVAVVFMQIALGGWTSTNYAAMACPDFPTCQAQWWPEADFGEGFVLWRGLGVNYEGGVLDGPARTAIHLAHRIGAVLTLLTVGGIALFALLRGRAGAVRASAAVTLAVLAAQLSLGIVIVLKMLPLGLAVGHNLTAALLFLSVVSLAHYTWRARVPALVSERVKAMEELPSMGALAGRGAMS